MRYDSYKYLYPPRPETAVAPTSLPEFEKLGWWAQAKMNGTNTTIYVPPDRQSFAMGRHGPGNRLRWQPGPRWRSFEDALPGIGWYVLVGELLHDKGVGVRDTIYLFDLLVDDGEYLIGTTYRERWLRLGALCNRIAAAPWTEPSHTVIAPGVWLTSNRRRAFSEWFKAIRDEPGKPPCEGIVFKNPDAKLLPCGRAAANAGWARKCRKATANLSF